MTFRTHEYETVVTWTGNLGTGTSHYKEYTRDHDLNAEGHATIAGSSDPTFRGDPSRWNPEQLQLGALSQCHMLSYLHLCAVNGVTVVEYEDTAHGVMTEDRSGGRFTEAVLRPRVVVTSPDMVAAAESLHSDAHRVCFIANSVNFPVRHEAVIIVQGGTDA